MLKGYAFGFFSAALAVLLVAAIWIGTQPKQESGLLWGDTVYTSRQEFDGYLKSKGLSYKTWVARNPGAAPWEPEQFTVGAITVRASTETIQLLLAAVGWILATAGALLLLRGGRLGGPGFAKAVAFFSAVLVGLLVAGFWFSTQSQQPPGLVWGGAVYTSKQEFKDYLKWKGLSYETWVARNPGAAPWEPAAVRRPAKAREATRVPAAPKAPEAGESWLGRPLQAAVGLILAAGCALLLLRRRRPVVARYATGSVAFFSPSALRFGRGSAIGPLAFASSQRLGVLASGATGRLRASIPRNGARVRGATRGIVRQLINGARDVDRLVVQLMRERDIGVGKVALGLLTAVAAVTIVLLLSSCSIHFDSRPPSVDPPTQPVP